jgi:hypothetical protein
MPTAHFIGGWWIVFFFLPFFFWRRSGRWGYRDPRAAARAPELDESIRVRLELVDQLETRVAELENRLDFTERLLAERKEQKLESR